MVGIEVLLAVVIVCVADRGNVDVVDGNWGFVVDADTGGVGGAVCRGQDTVRQSLMLDTISDECCHSATADGSVDVTSCGAVFPVGGEQGKSDLEVFAEVGFLNCSYVNFQVL